MTTHFEYIRFVEQERPNGRKTSIWTCVNNSFGSDLGTVSWDPHWRMYVLRSFERTIWSPGCLRDVAAFIDSLMAERAR